MAGDRRSKLIGKLLNRRYLLTAQFTYEALNETRPAEKPSKVEREISGEMFKASDVNLRREVAIKIFTKLSADKQDDLASHAQIAAQLNHQNITALYDWGIDEFPYLVTELCRGQSLSLLFKYCRARAAEGHHQKDAFFEGGLSLAQVAFIGNQAAEGLAHAHSKGVAHLNLSPTNLLFDLAGRVKLSDFEIAKIVEKKSKRGRLLGESFYSAPEQLASEMPISEGDEGQAADIFSLGLMLLEAALGVPPFDEGEQMKTYIERINSDIQIPEELGELGDILALAVKREPAQRPSATEFAWHLHGFLQGMEAPAPLPLQISDIMRSHAKVNWKKYVPVVPAMPAEKETGGIDETNENVTTSKGDVAEVANQNKEEDKGDVAEVVDAGKEDARDQEREAPKDDDDRTLADRLSHTYELGTQKLSSGIKKTTTSIKKTGKSLKEKGENVKEKVTESVKERVAEEDFITPAPINISKEAKISKYGLMFAVLCLLTLSVLVSISVTDRFEKGVVANPTIPNVVGLSPKEAKDILGTNWQVRELFLRFEEVEENTVALTSPPAGEELKEGEVISITSSVGHPHIPLPVTLFGEALTVAEPRISGIGLKIGQIYLREGERLIPVSRSQVNSPASTLVGFYESLSEVPFGSSIAIVITGPSPFE